MRLQPLKGTRVLDFTSLPPGGACTVMLADLGAETVRVEPPAQKGKPSLVMGQVALSRGKRSVTLDLRSPASAEVLKRLAPQVDVIVENARIGAMEERGFGFPQARAVNPGIIWCSITGFGQDGPNAELPGHDLSYLAHSGLLGALNDDRDWIPGISLSLQAGALCAVIGIQAALAQRQRTGVGAFIDISLSEAATWLLSCGIKPFSNQALLLRGTPDRRLYACADGRFVAIACAEPKTWGALCDGLCAPHLKPKLHDQESAATTTLVLEEIFRTRPAADWLAALAPTGAAVTTFNHAHQVLDDTHVKARGTVVEVGGTPVPACPVRMRSSDGSDSGTAIGVPPTTGADTYDILGAAGFSGDELMALTAAGLI